MAEPIKVQLDSRATAEEIAEVRAVFGEVGIDAEVEATWEKPVGVGNGAFWMILISLTITFGGFLKAYGESLGKAAGDATAEALRELVARLQQARRDSEVGDSGWVQFNDSDDTDVMIAPDIPQEAFDALQDLDWSEFEGGTMMWDPQTGEWFDPNRRYPG